MKRTTTIALLLLTVLPAAAQVTDPIYDRPFVARASSSTALGGYLEGNTNYFSQDGVSEGFSMELRRFNLFLYSSMGPRITFFSELEFEHGTEEIALETALVDVLLAPFSSLRAGILLPPLGQFNQNHDSPNWEFVERPLVSTELIPSTLSEVGFGLHGSFPAGDFSLGYQAYLVNGLGDGIVNNTEGRTHIPSGRDEEAFGEDNNGQPAFTARLEASLPGRGTLGISWYGGTYNSWRVEGEPVDDKRSVRIAAVDLAASHGPFSIAGEAAAAWIDVPGSLDELFGTRQRGAFLDVVYRAWSGRLGFLERAVVAASVRVEHLDHNVGEFNQSARKIYDQETALALGLSVRPGSETIFKLNYRYHWQRDLLGNPGRLGGFQAGLATYF